MLEPVAALHGHSDDVKSIAFSEKYGLVSCSRDGRVLRWRDFFSEEDCPIRFEELYTIDRVFLNSLAFLGNGRPVLLCGGSDGKIRAIDLESREIKLFEGHTSNVCCLATDPNSDDLFVSGSWDHSAQIWSYAEHLPLQQLLGHTASVWCCAFSSNSTTLLTGSADKSIAVWNKSSSTFQRAHVVKAHDDCVRSISFISDRRFVSASNDALIKAWEFGNNSEPPVCIQTLRGHTSFIFTVAFRSLLASAGEDRTIRIWLLDEEKFELMQVVRIPTETCWCLAWLDRGARRLASAFSDHSVRIFSSESTDIKENQLKSFDNELSIMDIPRDELEMADRKELMAADKLLLTG